MPQQTPLDIPLTRCHLLNPCADMQRPEWRTTEEWRDLYPVCAREQRGEVAACPHLERVKAWLAQRGQGEAGRLA